MLERITAKEWKDLIIAWLVIAFAFIPIFNTRGWFNIDGVLAAFSLSLVTVGIGFIIHESAHKFVALREGLWAEFKRNDLMLALAVIMAFAIGMVFAAPGAVMVYGGASTRQNGKIAAAGPISNIILAVIFILVIPVGGFIGVIGSFGARVNISLALFNMLPFGPLDGKKIWNYSRKKYMGIVCVGLGMMFLIFALI
jgi:Zn-dependent protease